MSASKLSKKMDNSSSSEEEWEKSERVKQQDLKEQEEFVERLKQKEKERTRQIVSKSEKKVRALKAMLRLHLIICLYFDSCCGQMLICELKFDM